MEVEEQEMDELRKRRQAELAQRAEAKRAAEQLKGALRTALDEDAYNRMMNVAAANEDFYLMAAKQVIMAFRRVGRRITEKELVGLLRAMKEQTEKETSITFHKK